MEEELGPVFESLSRAYANRVLNSNSFQQLAVGLTFGACVSAIITKPNPTSDYTSTWYENVAYIVYVLAVVEATVESMIRCHALGFWTFITHGFNQIDLVAICLSWPSVILPGIAYQVIALRCMRLLTVFPGVKAVMGSIFHNRAYLANLLVFFGFIVLFFIVGGLDFYGSGVMGSRCAYNASGVWLEAMPVTHCSLSSDGTKWNGYQCRGTLTCVRKWGNPNQGYSSFDNAGQASMLVLRLISLSDWKEVIYALQDGKDVYVWTLFALILLLTVFGVLNIVTAVIVHGYQLAQRHYAARDAKEEAQRAKEQLGVSVSPILVTGDFKAIEEARLVAMKLRLQGRENEARAVDAAAAAAEETMGTVTDDECFGLRKRCERLVQDPMFEGFVVAVIVLNTITMAMHHADAGATIKDIVSFGELFFTWFFVLEAALRIWGLGVSRYFGDRWNIFDFTVVLLSVISMFEDSGSFSALRTFRLFRALRFLRIMRRFPEMIAIISSLASCVEAMWSISLFILFVIVTYAIIGMQIFGNKYQPNPILTPFLTPFLRRLTPFSTLL